MYACLRLTVRKNGIKGTPCKSDFQKLEVADFPADFALDITPKAKANVEYAKPNPEWP
jgi:hypothetical protein